MIGGRGPRAPPLLRHPRLAQSRTVSQTAVVVIHHVRKLGSDDWIDQASGTLGLAGAADGLLGLFGVRGESQAALKVTGRDVEEHGLPFDPDLCNWVAAGRVGPLSLDTRACGER